MQRYTAISYRLTFRAASAVPESYCQHRGRGAPSTSQPLLYQGRENSRVSPHGFRKRPRKASGRVRVCPSTAPLPPHLSSSCGAVSFFKKKDSMEKYLQSIQTARWGLCSFLMLRVSGQRSSHNSPCNKLSNKVQRNPSTMTEGQLYHKKMMHPAGFFERLQVFSTAYTFQEQKWSKGTKPANKYQTWHCSRQQNNSQI